MEESGVGEETEHDMDASVSFDSSKTIFSKRNRRNSRNTLQDTMIQIKPLMLRQNSLATIHGISPKLRRKFQSQEELGIVSSTEIEIPTKFEEFNNIFKREIIRELRYILQKEKLIWLDIISAQDSIRINKIIKKEGIEFFLWNNKVPKNWSNRINQKLDEFLIELAEKKGFWKSIVCERKGELGPIIPLDKFFHPFQFISALMDYHAKKNNVKNKKLLNVKCL